MTPAVTALYAGILALAFLALSAAVVRRRRRTGISLGDEGNTGLRRLLRAHGNFAEYVPLALILMALAEMSGAAPWLLHGIGLALLVGRVLHAHALIGRVLRARVAGMALTFASIALGALACLWVSL